MDAHIGRIYGDRYRIDSLVGTGASARVYESTDTMLRRKVALKVLHPALVGDPRFKKRFRAEAQSAAQLSNPYVVAVHDWGEHDDEAYLVTELLTGGSLRDYLDSGRRLSVSQALLVGLQGCKGLAAAHSKGLVHRDIKPANLLFDDQERLRVADFGIARAVAESAWTEPEGAMVGTVRYAAPEQGLNSDIDGRTDVYSLALTIIESVTGEVPLIGATPIATMVMRQDSDVEVPESLGQLRSALTPATRANRLERPTAEEFAAALNRAASRLPKPLPLNLDQASGHTQAVVDQDKDAVLDLDKDTVRLPDADETLVEYPKSPDPSDEGGRGRRWRLLAPIGLLIAGVAAFFGYRYYQDEVKIPTHTVGSYVGDQLDDVTNEIEVNRWLITVTEIRQDASSAGEVLEQSPEAGSMLEENQPINLVVSLGQELRSGPLVVGLEIGEATETLEAAGLVVGQIDSSIYDEEVPAGVVLTSSLPPGEEVEAGTEVDLSVSAGPQPRQVPAVEGLSEKEVGVLLEELGLTMTTTEEFSDSVGEGLAISVSPAPGAEVERGSELQVVFSKGVPFFEIPNVVGLDAVTAANRLEEAGFVVADTNGPPNAVVLATDPPAGEFHPKGRSIVIFTRR